MKEYLVIGNPITHSLSPELHNYWIRENSINGIYNKKKLINTVIPIAELGTRISFCQGHAQIYIYILSNYAACGKRSYI